MNRPFPIALRRDDGRYNVCCDDRQLLTALRVLRANEHQFMELAFITDDMAKKCDPEQVSKANATCSGCENFEHKSSLTICQRCMRNSNFKDHWRPRGGA